MPRLKLKKCMLIIAILGGITGCSLSPERNSTQFISLFTTNTIPHHLVNRAWLEKFTFLTADKKQSLLIKTELMATEIRLVAMTFEGVALLQAKWQADKNKIIQGSSLPSGLDARQVFQDLQSVNWPVKHLESELSSGVAVKEYHVAHKKVREFYLNGQLLISIEYEKKSIRLNNLRQHYELEIIRLEDDKQ